MVEACFTSFVDGCYLICGMNKERARLKRYAICFLIFVSAKRLGYKNFHDFKTA